MIEAIAKLPRTRIGCYPTPLMEAEHLSKVLGGPRILIKRDDLTGLALGGNKCRKFEFLMGDVKQRGFDSFLVSSSSIPKIGSDTSSSSRIENESSDKIVKIPIIIPDTTIPIITALFTSYFRKISL